MAITQSISITIKHMIIRLANILILPYIHLLTIVV